MITETETLLIRILRLLKIEKEAIAGILISLRDENDQWELMYWLEENREATQEEILLKTAQIATK